MDKNDVANLRAATRYSALTEALQVSGVVAQALMIRSGEILELESELSSAHLIQRFQSFLTLRARRMS